jgi:antirestriction protein ArdC
MPPTWLAGWLKVLKDDKRAIFTAAAHAQKAADFLDGLQPGSVRVALPTRDLTVGSTLT